MLAIACSVGGQGEGLSADSALTLGDAGDETTTTMTTMTTMTSGATAPASTDGGSDGSSGEDTGTWQPDPNGPAFLHADVWSTFFNDRTRCGAERAFLNMCQARGEADCSQYQAAWDACDPWQIVYGQVGPEKQGDDLCSRGMYPDIGGCDATAFDFDVLRFWWYGAEWQGNWPMATIKIFEQGADWTGGGEIIALSNLPGHQQAGMAGVDNHGLGYGCTMPGQTSGDAAYKSPFGGFAWIEVPTDRPVTVVSAAATNFADEPFQGCSRGDATQTPWITDGPGAMLGCIYVVDMQFEPGHRYLSSYGQIVELDQPDPPQALVDAFARPELGIDITSPDACALP